LRRRGEWFYILRAAKAIAVEIKKMDDYLLHLRSMNLGCRPLTHLQSHSLSLSLLFFLIFSLSLFLSFSHTYSLPYINVREHLTWVFLPQPKQIDLEITNSSLTTKNVTCHTCVLSCAAMTSLPLCPSLLGHAKVISRWPNKYLEFIPVSDADWYFWIWVCKFDHF